jgi:hypothetical protein
MGWKNNQALALLFCLLLAGGCGKDDTRPVLPANTAGRKVYVVCEGSLGNGNGALSLYLPDIDSVFEDVYKAANGQNIGDIFQSMTHIGNQFFLCVNNSDKIVIINRDNWKKEGQITVSKPRYMLPLGSEKAFAGTLFSNGIAVVNPSAGALANTGTIYLPYKNPEGMALLNDKVYVAMWDTACSKLYALDPALATHPVIDSIALLGRAPQDVLVDKEQKLWILAGNAYQNVGATLTRIDPATKQQLQVYTFPSGADPIRPVLNETKDTLYFIEVNYNGGTTHNGIYRMGIRDAVLPQQPFIQAQGFQYFWALGIQPGTGYIYVGDPKGFIQRGTVNIYRQDGSLLKSFGTGIGPGRFYFDQ